MVNEDRARDRTASNSAASNSDSNSSGRRKKTPEERPFDLWLQKQLHSMYDEIASEPLPDDLVDLIGRDAAAARNKQPEPPREPRNSKKK